MKHEKEKKPQNRDGLNENQMEQFIVLVRYSVNTSPALCDFHSSFFVAAYLVSLPHSSVVGQTVHSGTIIPILISLLAAEDIRKWLSVQTY